MRIHSKSFFKDETADRAWFEGWVTQLAQHHGRAYERYELPTSLGITHVWGLNSRATAGEVLVIFPGARTTSLIWDLDRGLDHLGSDLRIFMVETNGLPNLSEGNTPDIHSTDYGLWAAEVLARLNIEKAWVAGASFGGLICMKLGMVYPEKVKAAFLLNPGCLQPFSLSFKNLYYNLLPLFSPSEKNVRKFLDKAIFSKPNHQLSAFSEQLLIDYEVFAISRYKDNTQKPYFMGPELAEAKIPVYLLLGDQDLLFPVGASLKNAEKYLYRLEKTDILGQVGHGIETHAPALKRVGEQIRSLG